MKLSTNTLFVEDFPQRGKYLVYNTRTRAQVVIDGRLKTILESLPPSNGGSGNAPGAQSTGGAPASNIDVPSENVSGVENTTSTVAGSAQAEASLYEGATLTGASPTQTTAPLDKEETAAVPAGYSSLCPQLDQEAAAALTQLKSMGFVLDDGVDEGKLLEEWFARVKSDSSKVKATILTTYDCNFACTYCVEEGVRDPIYMDDGTAERAVSYIKGRVEKKNPQSLFVTFYGGEPLLNRRAIKAAASRLKAFCDSAGIPFNFGITTNGSLLTSRVVDELKPLGLKGVKITLDGFREEHDKKRLFKNGRGSFDIIIKRILSVIDKIDVNIGGNFDPQSLDSILKLMDYLVSLGLHKKLNLVDFKHILPTIRDRDNLIPEADMGCSYADSSVMEAVIELKKALLERGFNTRTGTGVVLCSMVINDSNFVIDPLGNIYRCPAFAGYKEFVAGHIDKPGEEDFSTVDLWKRCLNCVYAPVCGDGCLYISYVRFGDARRLNCQKAFIDYTVKENLKLNYTYRKKVDRNRDVQMDRH